MIKSINPTTGQLIKEFVPYDQNKIDELLNRAKKAQKLWASQSIKQRVKLLEKLSIVLEERKQDYAKLITSEVGKPINEALAEISKCAWNCNFYAQKAEEFLAEQIIPTSFSLSKVVYEPLGLVLAVMPWNYPFWQVLRFAAPVLAAGNGVILKHASNVAQSSLAIEKLFNDAGAPEGLFTSLLIPSTAVQSLIYDPRIAALTLTGSTNVGKIIASQASALIKKQVLELGGLDPFIVLEDADIEIAAKTAVKARFQNNGQSCIAAKRFIIVDEIADQFLELLSNNLSKLKIGNPIFPDTDLGPMARDDLREELDKQVQESIKKGAKLVMGGKKIEALGFFYEPTILDFVTKEMVVANQETFGPVAVIMRVKNIKEAIELANDIDYGLGASLWTKNIELALSLAHEIESGAVFINSMTISDPRLPFGGIKQSGYGRELGVQGIREFTNVKNISCQI